MKLERLHVRRLPGIDAPFELGADELGPGVTLIHGPNGTGKSSVARALSALLWPASSPGEGLSLEAGLSEGPARWRVEREGQRVRWYLDGELVDAPALPADHARDTFVVRADELLRAQETDAQFAEAVRVAMSGGVDLPSVRTELTPRPQVGANRARELKRARAQLATDEREQSALLAEAERLPELDQELAGVQAELAEVSALEAARTLVVVRARLAELEQRRSAFPRGADQLVGDELERLERARSVLEDEGAAAAELDAREERARADVQASRLAAPLERSEVDGRRAALNKLEASEVKLLAARDRRLRLETGLEEARAALGAETDVTKLLAVGAGELDALAELAQESASRTERRARLQRRKEELELSNDEAGPDLEDVGRARTALHDWLASAHDARGPGPSASSWVGVAGVLLAAVLMGLFVHPAAYALAAIAVWMTWSLRGAASPASGGSVAREHFERSGLAGPADWSVSSVEARLNELEDERARAVERMRIAHEREGLTPELDALEASETAHAERRAELGARLGLDLGSSRLALDDLARRLEALRATHVELTAEVAAEHATESHIDEWADAIGEFLRVHGEDPKTPDAEALRAALVQLEERSELFRKAREERERVDQDRRGVEQRRARSRGEIERLFERAGLQADDDGGLAAALAVREECAEVQGLLVAQRSLAAEAEAQLAGRPELAELELALIDQRLASAQTASERLEELRSERADLQARLGAARRGRALERLGAEVRKHEHALQEERETVLEQTAASVLLDAIEEEHTTRARPVLVQRARELFSTYTRGAYDLDADARDGSLFARRADRPDRRLGLEELSSGTRVQLLLAARIAYLESAERGLRLPLVLDDALVNSDAERVGAVAGSLFELAAEGRQVIVLSCEPGDERLLREGGGESSEGLRVVDLAALRGLQASERRRERLAPPELVDVPPVAGRSPEVYAQELGVAALDARAPLEDLDLFWLLHDDLAVLRELRRRRVERYGHYLRLREGGAGLGLEAAAHESLAQAARLARHVLEAWRVGRGRALSPAALMACPAISQNYQEQAEELAAKVDWDAARLIAGLNSGELKMKGFRRSKLVEAESWMQEQGHLSPESPLELDQARRNVVLALGESAESNPLELHRDIDFLWARCEAGA